MLLRLVYGLRLVSVVLAFLVQSRPCVAQTASVIQIDFTEVVHPVSAAFFVEGLQHAAQTKADAVIVRLNTPGGLSDSMRTMVEAVLNSPVPVVIWVGPSGSRAASAGFFLLLASDLAVMAPGTNTGAAHPISLTGGEIPTAVEQKIVNDAASFLRSYVSKRGRNAELAEQAVTKSRSFSDDEALKYRLIDAVAKDVPELIQTFDGREIRRFDGRVQAMRLGSAVIQPFEMTRRQKLLSWVMNPNVAVVLALIGLVGLYIEVSHPGFILPGVAGGISLILALLAFNLLPINVGGILLMLLAIVLLVMEATVTSHGVLAIGGIVALVTGGLMLVEGPIPELRIRMSTMLAIAVPLALIAMFLVRLVYLSHRGRSPTGDSGIVGVRGTAITPIHKTGKIAVQGEVWNAWSKQAIPQGETVRIVGAEGLTLEVESGSEDK